MKHLYSFAFAIWVAIGVYDKETAKDIYPDQEPLPTAILIAESREQIIESMKNAPFLYKWELGKIKTKPVKLGEE